MVTGAYADDLDVKESTKQSIPTVALVLSVAGLVPFVFLAVASQLVDGLPSSEAHFALAAYGAVILSFLGGVHWGGACRASGGFTWSTGVFSVLPSLVGWSAIILPTDFGLLVLSFAFALMLIVDHRAISHGMLPQWYWRLRWPLTLIVVLSLVVGFF